MAVDKVIRAEMALVEGRAQLDTWVRHCREQGHKDLVSAALPALEDRRPKAAS